MISRTPIAAWAAHVVHLHAARVFIEGCAADGIEVLPVKGILAAHTLYENAADRLMTDVDVRVRPRDYPRIADVARRHGWAIVETKRAYGNCVLKVESVHVDVECAIGPPHVSALRVDDLLANATSSDLLGFRAFIPEFTDHVVLQIVNVFKDKIVRAFEWTKQDLALITSHPEFDAHLIAARLRDNKTTTLGWIVADYAARDLGFARWSEVRDALGPPRRPLYARAARLAQSRPEGLAAILLARAGSDDPIERMRATIAMARLAIERRAQRKKPAGRNPAGFPLHDFVIH